MKTRNINVYAHIPFCTGVCSYCHYVRVPNEPHLVEDYLNAVKLEFALHKKYLGDFTAASLYLGGGTPTYLTEKQITDFLTHIRENINTPEDIEVTSEASPETLTKEKLYTLKNLGINRLSIGVQAFNDHLLLKVCGRRHNEKMAVAAVNQAKKMGFERGVNIDLIYGLPDQTLEHWTHTLKTIEDLTPEFITLYQLRIKKGTRISHTPAEKFPNEYTSRVMYVSAIEFLMDLGYTQIAPNQFSLPGYSFEHQEQKWRNNELLGLGVSAYSYINNTVYNNVRAIADYGDSVHKGHLPVYIGKKLSKEEEMTRAIIFGLKLSGVNRKDGGLNKKEFREKYGMTVEAAFGETLKKLRELGLIKTTRQFIQLTYKGILFSDEVCREFYTPQEKEYLEKIGHKYGRGIF